MEDWILYGRVEDTGTKKAAFRFLRAEHGLFGKRKSFFCWEYQYEYEGERGRAQGSSTLPRKFRGDYFIRLQTASA